MKLIFTSCLFILSCFFSVRLSAQSFAKEYHLGTATTWQVIKPTADGNLIAIGDYTETETSPNIIMITKLSVDGNVIWSKTYGGDIQQNGLNIIETTDGSFVIAGVEFVYDFSTSEFSATGCLIKISQEGTLRWSRYVSYGNRNYFLLSHVAATPNGGVIIGGNFEQFSGGTVGSFGYLAKVDADGNRVWQKQFDTKSYRRWIADIFCSKQIVTVVSESSIGNGNNAKDAAAITLLNETDGTVIASKQFRLPDANIHFIQTATATPDGGIAVSGTAGKGVGDFDIWTFKTDNKLSLQWSNLVARGNDDRPNKMYSDTNGNIIVGGTSSGSDGFFHSYLLWLSNDSGRIIKSQWLDDISRGVFDITSAGDNTYALTNQQYGTGSNPFTSLYVWQGMNGVCTKSASSGIWQETINVTTDNRKLPATDITATITNMNYTVADVAVITNNLCSVLPLTLLSFQGVYQNEKATLTWQTANESNTSFFKVERSIDGGGHYIKAGMVTGAGSNSNSYSFIDKSPAGEHILYRLKITDKDGKESYSHSIEVSIPAKAVLLYPNPVKNELNIQLTLQQTSSIQAAIINATGQIIILQSISGNAGTINKTIDVSKLTAGMYFINISGAHVNETLRFEKQ